MVTRSSTGFFLNGMRNDSRIGMVAPEGHLLPLADYLGGNADAIDYLRARLGLSTPSGPARFVSGSMFWVRLSALRILTGTDPVPLFPLRRDAALPGLGGTDLESFAGRARDGGAQFTLQRVDGNGVKRH